MQVVRLRASTRRVMTPSVLARAETVGYSLEPALRFAPRPWLPAVSRWLLGGHVPACLFARLFTSSLNSASARPLTAASVAGRPYGPGEGSTEPVSPDPLASVAVLGGFRFVPGSVLPGSAMDCESNMLPFDVRHPSRDALASFGECAMRLSNEPKLNFIVRRNNNADNCFGYK